MNGLDSTMQLTVQSMKINDYVPLLHQISIVRMYITIARQDNYIIGQQILIDHRGVSRMYLDLAN